MATEHLIKSGHSRIAFATLPMSKRTREETYSGYCQALRSADLEPDAALNYVYEAEKPTSHRDNLELEAGEAIAKRFVCDGCPASAFVCMNDMLAIGLTRALMRLNVKVPDEVAVFGFDDIPLAETNFPALSTVPYPAEESGRLACLLLLDKIENRKNTLNISMQLMPSLVLRETAP